MNCNIKPPTTTLFMVESLAVKVALVTITL